MVAANLPPKLNDGGAADFTIPAYLRHGSKIPPPTEADLDTEPVQIRLDRYGHPVPPDTLYVRDSALEAMLSTQIAKADDVELIVRRRYWRYLNDPYRDLYRNHRKLVDDSAKQAKVSNTVWRKLAAKLTSAALLAAKLPENPSSTFTVPPYSITQHQQDNMHALLHLLLKSENPDPLEGAELHRELGDYDEAQKAIDAFKGVEHTASRLIRQLIGEKVNEPMRWL